MTRHLLLAAVLLLTLSGCAGYPKVQDSNPPFAEHHYRYYDLDVQWRAERSDGALRLTGTVRNLRDLYLQDLELNARLVNLKGKVIARDSYTDFPVYIRPGTTEPFQLQFRVPPGEEAKEVRFSYYYYGVEAPPAFGIQDDVPHFGGFVSPP